MKALEVHEMEVIAGSGCDEDVDKALATIGFIAGVGSTFGPIGLAIFGPTALAVGVASLACAYS